MLLCIFTKNSIKHKLLFTVKFGFKALFFYFCAEIQSKTDEKLSL